MSYSSENQNFSELLCEEFDGHVGLISLVNDRAELFYRYLRLVELWSPKIDLVSPGSSEDIFFRHFADSIWAWWTLFNSGVLPSAGAFLDIGSGAGFPGMVFSLMENERRVILSEPREKRRAFLSEVRSALGLGNVKICAERMEDLSRDDFEPISLICNRALGSQGQFLTYASGLLSIDGRIVILVSDKWAASEADLDSRVEFLECFEYRIRGRGIWRKLAVFRPAGR